MDTGLAPTRAVMTAAHPRLLQRRGGWLLVLGVLAAHLAAVDVLVRDRIGWGQGERVPPRIDVAFVRELQQAAPVAAPALPVAAPMPRRVLVQQAQAASAPRRAASAAVVTARTEPPPEPPPESPPESPPKSPPEAPPPGAGAAVAAAEAAPASAPGADAMRVPAGAGAPAAAAPAPALAAVAAGAASTAATTQVRPFEWPPSTRLTYTLRGYYRGPIEGGSASVEWLRAGAHYQVHLETSLAPLLTRRITSDGELTEHGLAPRRFDAEQKVLFKAPRRWTLSFGPQRIALVDGREIDTVPGVQDEASQFVQLTWLFTTQPERMRVGQSIELPLVLNRRLDRWIYDVKEQQTLQLGFGAVPTYYVRPRREARAGDMTAEIWFAPTLQYLPVRIVIRQDESTYIDLTLERPPLQADAEAGVR